IILLGSLALASQVVELSGRIEPDPAGGARIVAVASIASGFHVNAHRPDEEFLIPTELTITSPGVAVEEAHYPAPVAKRLAFAGDKPVLVYDGSVEISAHVQPAPSAPVEIRL